MLLPYEIPSAYHDAGAEPTSWQRRYCPKPNSYCSYAAQAGGREGTAAQYAYAGAIYRIWRYQHFCGAGR